MHGALSGWTAPVRMWDLENGPEAGWTQDETDGLDADSSELIQTGVMFDPSSLPGGSRARVTKAILTYGETAMQWTNGEGEPQQKPNGCVVVRIPSVDWTTTEPPLLIPYIADPRSSAPKQLGPQEWDVTEAFRWQLDPSSRGLTPPGQSPPPVGFGFLLTGAPDVGRLDADDDTTCRSRLSDIRLRVTFTVAPAGAGPIVK